VFDTVGNEVSLRKPATSNCGGTEPCYRDGHGSSPPSSIVDGNPGTCVEKACWIGRWERGDWVEIDLGVSVEVSKVVFYGRSDGG